MSEGDRSPQSRLRGSASIQLEELSRRNSSALGMDALYLITTGFFTVLTTKAWQTLDLGIPLTSLSVTVPYSWPLLIAAIPLLGLLYFGVRSSLAFFTAQVGMIGLTLLAVWAGVVPF